MLKRLREPEPSTNPLAGLWEKAGHGKGGKFTDPNTGAGGKKWDFKPYQTDLVGYAQDILKVSLWAGMNDQPGQLEIARDIDACVQAQLEAFARGESAGVNRIFRVEAGHGIGKTMLLGVIVNWFFDCFAPSICLTTAPTNDQVVRLLWKEIKSRRNAITDLPGRVMGEPEMRKSDEHFALGRTTNDTGGQGATRFQGTHGEFLLYAIDEAEGVPEFVFDAINAMMTGGCVVLCIMIANPKTRSSRFAKLASSPRVNNYRMDVLDHPNVVTNSQIVPNATTRDWVNGMMDDHCERVLEHKEDDFTFCVPWQVDEITLEPIIWKPDSEFLFRVRGIAPLNVSARTYFTVGSYEAAIARGKTNTVQASDQTRARIGVDVARFGTDPGTVYLEQAGIVERKARLYQEDSDGYLNSILQVISSLPGTVTSLHVRIDGSGGFASGIVDGLKKNTNLYSRFPDFKVIEVQFGSSPTPPQNEETPQYANKITELYATAAKHLPALAIKHAPPELLDDLTDRQFEFVQIGGFAVHALTKKEIWRKSHGGRSPDDGDGFVLCTAPDFAFEDQLAYATIPVFDMVIPRASTWKGR